MRAAVRSLCCLFALFQACAMAGASQEKISFYKLEDDSKAVSFGSVREKLPKSVADKFEPDWSQVTYAMKLSHRGDFLNLDEHSGALTSRGPLNRQEICQPVSSPDCREESKSDVCEISAQLFIANQQRPELTDSIAMTITVGDINNSPPRFQNSRLDFDVLESASLYHLVNLPKAEDADRSGFASCHLDYELHSCTPGEQASPKFRLELKENENFGPRDVQLKLMGQLDRETVKHYRYCLFALDTSRTHTATVTLDLRIKDVNDNAPVWQPGQNFSISVSEAHPPDPLLRLHATDADSEFGRVEYRLLTNRGLFYVTSDGNLKLKNSNELDYEQVKEHRVVVAAVDNGETRKSTTATVTITVLDANDNAPKIVISDSHVKIVENNQVPRHFLNILVYDEDTGDGGKVTCSLPSEPHGTQRFLLTKGTSLTTYELKTNQSLDREVEASYHILIQCADHGVPQRTGTEKVYVEVLDQNDNEPRFEVSPMEFSIAEDARVFSNVYEFRVHDPDHDSHNSANRKFIIVGEGVAYFDVECNSQDGGRCWLKTLAQFNREAKDNYKFSLVVQDINGTESQVIHKAETNVSVRILDINDCQPWFVADPTDTRAVANCSLQPPGPVWLPPVTVLENATVGSLVTTVRAVDCDLGPNGTIYYELRQTHNSQGPSDWGRGSHPHFRLEVKSGKLTLSRPLNADGQDGQSKFTLELLAKDGGSSPQLTGTASLIVNVEDVNDNQPEFVRTSELMLKVSCDKALPNNRVTTPEDVEARDADASEANRQLGYRLIDFASDPGQPPSAQLHSLRIDKDTGHVYLSSTPELCTARFYRFQLEVYNRDKPRAPVSRKRVRIYFEGGGRRGGSSATGIGDHRGASGSGDGDSTLSADGRDTDDKIGGFGGSEDTKSAIMASALIVFLALLVALTALAVMLLLRWCLRHRQRGVQEGSRSRTLGTSADSSSVYQQNQRQQSISCPAPMDTPTATCIQGALLEDFATVLVPTNNGSGAIRRYDSLVRQHPQNQKQKQQQQLRRRNASLNNGVDDDSVDDDVQAMMANAASATRTMPANSTRNYRSQQLSLQQHLGAYQALLAKPQHHHAGSEGHMTRQWGSVAAAEAAEAAAVGPETAALSQTRSCSRMIDSKRPSKPSSLKSSYLTITNV